MSDWKVDPQMVDDYIEQDEAIEDVDEAIEDVYVPFMNCGWKSSEDGCCSHPNNATPECHMKTAQEMFAAVSNLAEFPEDDWQGIGDGWDLNLYVDGDGKNCATLYAVVNGNTDTEVGYPVTPA